MFSFLNFERLTQKKKRRRRRLTNSLPPPPKKMSLFRARTKARSHRSRRAISVARASRSGASTFSSRSRAVAPRKKRSRVPSIVHLSRARFSPIRFKMSFFFLVVAKSTNGRASPFRLCKFRKDDVALEPFRVHATSRATSPALAATQKCGFLSKRCAPLVCAPSLRVSSLVAFFFR